MVGGYQLIDLSYIVVSETDTPIAINHNDKLKFLNAINNCKTIHLVITNEKGEKTFTHLDYIGTFVKSFDYISYNCYEFIGSGSYNDDGTQLKYYIVIETDTLILES